MARVVHNTMSYKKGSNENSSLLTPKEEIEHYPNLYLLMSFLSGLLQFTVSEVNILDSWILFTIHWPF